MKRFLITTADERSWKFDRPVLFLGEWCRLYTRRDIWSKMDADVAAPYGLAVIEKDRDLAYVQSLASALLTEATDALNRFHGTAHGTRYWQIVIGQWLQRFVALAFNRYHTVRQALATYEISGTTVFDFNRYHLAANDSNQFIWACNDDEWNNVFYSQVIRELGGIPIEVDAAALDGKTGFIQPPVMSSPPRGLRARSLALARRWLPRLTRQTDAFITNTYLPSLVEAQLKVSLAQAPQLWNRETVAEYRPDPNARKALRLDGARYEGFERFVRCQFSNVIPSCYLEGFGALVRQTQRLPWPSRPAFVFTSNNFDTDEPFKVWAATKAEEGFPYFTGQHGNNYGTLKGSENWTEVVTPDAFFTWGWKNGNDRNVPSFLFKTAGRKAPRSDAAGRLLLIELPLPHRLTLHDSYQEFVAYQEDQFMFVESLPETIRSQVTVRLHSGSRQVRWFEQLRWAERCPGAQLEMGAARIVTLIEQSRLIVHSYDSTGILETLAWNLPTMCFWQGGLDHLLPHARPYYQLLRDVGILADSARQAAALATARWESVDHWWMSPPVQAARRKFCDEYARSERRPVRTLRRLLLSRARNDQRRGKIGGGDENAADNTARHWGFPEVHDMRIMTELNETGRNLPRPGAGDAH
jgi:putative transferase (TIGR04331 family)